MPIQTDISTYPPCKSDCHCANCRSDLFIGTDLDTSEPAKPQFNTWVRDAAVDRAFPCRACKGAGSCSVCHTL